MLQSNKDLLNKKEEMVLSLHQISLKERCQDSTHVCAGWRCRPVRNAFLRCILDNYFCLVTRCTATNKKPRKKSTTALQGRRVQPLRRYKKTFCTWRHGGRKQASNRQTRRDGGGDNHSLETVGPPTISVFTEGRTRRTKICLASSRDEASKHGKEARR